MLPRQNNQAALATSVWHSFSACVGLAPRYCNFFCATILLSFDRTDTLHFFYQSLKKFSSANAKIQQTSLLNACFTQIWRKTNSVRPNFYLDEKDCYSCFFLGFFFAMFLLHLLCSGLSLVWLWLWCIIIHFVCDMASLIYKTLCYLWDHRVLIFSHILRQHQHEFGRHFVSFLLTGLD